MPKSTLDNLKFKESENFPITKRERGEHQINKNLIKIFDISNICTLYTNIRSEKKS